MKRKIFRWIQYIVLVYCIIGIALYYLQDNYLFHPEPLPADYSFQFDIPFKEVNIPYSHESNMNVVQFLPADTPTRGVVLYFHGNAGNINEYAPHAATFTRDRYEVWMLDYPGYGKSTGEFSEPMLYDWALTFYKLARARYSRDSIIVYGRSLGAGIASQLAAVRDCKALILEAPFYSLPSVVGSWFPIYPVHTMIRMQLPTWQHLQNVTAPVTVFHGTSDRTIPYRNAKRLIPFLKESDVFITIEGGEHNNLSSFPAFHEKIHAVLSK